MSDKSTFTPEEWKGIREVPHLVSLAVATAGASGIFGTMKEAFSSSASLVEGMKSDSALLRAICSREEISSAQTTLRESVGQLQGSDYPAVQEKLATLAVNGIQSALDTIRRKGDAADAVAFASFVDRLGKRVAESAKEGGFLGIGGERVSGGERQVLERLAKATASTAQA